MILYNILNTLLHETQVSWYEIFHALVMEFKYFGFQVFRLRTSNTLSQHTSPVISLEVTMYWFWCWCCVVAGLVSQYKNPLLQLWAVPCLPPVVLYSPQLALSYWRFQPIPRRTVWPLYNLQVSVLCLPVSCSSPTSLSRKLHIYLSLMHRLDPVVFEWCCHFFFQRIPYYFNVRNPRGCADYPEHSPP